MTQRMLSLVYASERPPAQLINPVPFTGDFRMVPANRYMGPEVQAEFNTIGVTGSAVNPIVIEDHERAPDLLDPQDAGRPSRAENALHQINDLQHALQVEKDKNKDFLRQRKRLIRQNKNLLAAQEREERREHRRQREAHEAERRGRLQQKEMFDLLVRGKEQADALGRQLGNELATAEKTIRLLQRRQVPDCPICLEALCRGVTQCGHQFCVSCFDLWYQEQSAKGVAYSCPTCRASLTDLDGEFFIVIYGMQ